MGIRTDMMNSFSPASMRLWHLISPTLPVGSFCYSQGLEYAVEAGWVNDEASAAEWIQSQLQHNLSRLDVPVLLRVHAAWGNVIRADAEQNSYIEGVRYWNRMLLALRESSEIRDEDRTLGGALNKLLRDMDINMPDIGCEELAYVVPFAYACRHWKISHVEAAHGILWSWCENQVAAAIKLVPLGQTAGQRILSSAVDSISVSVEQALACEDEDIGLLAPALAIGSALHESQYSRLFRS